MKKGFITIQQSPHDTRAMCICPTEKVNDFYINDFSQYQEELKYLFEVYTDKEIETLFILLTKLYTGIENLEKKAAILQHDNGLESTAESIIHDAVKEQSLSIDAVSGAAVSSKCILKAVENAIEN